MRVGAKYAEQDYFVVFGIKPTGPETGYGYIRNSMLGDQVHQVAQFVEKPDLDTAKTYVSSGEYSWNSGMFLLKASTYLRVLEGFEPEMAKFSAQAYAERDESADFIRLDAVAFEQCPSTPLTMPSWNGGACCSCGFGLSVE